MSTSGGSLTVRGQKLFYRDEGEGAPLLLVHGFPLDHTMWSGQFNSLADRFRLIAFDLPGFGQSELAVAGPRPVLTMQRMADDLALALDVLGVREPIVFCGLSMGGYIAWQFWKHHRARLSRLILCDTRAAGDSPEAAENRRQLADRASASGAEVVADAMLPKLFGANTKRLAPELLERTRKVMLATSPTTLAATLRGMAEREDMTASLSQVTIPSLVLCGEQDAITPSAEMQSIAAAMPAASFVEIPGVGHMAPLESPDVVNAAIKVFLH